MEKPFGLLRAGFPYHLTLGMRRVTSQPVDIVLATDGLLFVLNRQEVGGEIRRTNMEDEDLDTIGSGFVWPSQMISDSEGKLYVSDEGKNDISIWGQDGKSYGSWGISGTGEGELDHPAGLVFDFDQNLWVVDTGNHRVQKFTKDGEYLSSFGSHGTGLGQLDSPWGIIIDDDGDIYVSDWGNNRVQKFDSSGEFIMEFGPGSGTGDLSGPAGVAVDGHGDVYVADRGNNRVVQFDYTGRYVSRFMGDAGLSKSGRIYMMANARAMRAREMTTLEDSSRLRGPVSVRLGEDGLLFIPDFGSHRIQIYRKEAYVMDEGQILPEPKSPFLYTV